MMFSFLNKSYPHTTNLKRGLFNNFLIGCFIGLFLIIFQPFEINAWVTEHKVLKLIGFGIVSFIIPTLVGIFMLIFIPEKVLEDQWKVWKEILMIIVVLALIAFGNMVYLVILGITSISLNGYIDMLITTCLLGVFPVTGSVVVKYNRLLKINLAQAALVNQALHKHLAVHNYKKPLEQPNRIITDTSLSNNDNRISNNILLVAENEKDKLELKPEQLLYIESADNYSDVIYLDGKERKKQLIRSSLKRMESQINSADIVRCHRTFIVNLSKVKSIEGNAAGYRLYLYDTADIIPVSRNYGTSIVAKLKLLK
jgi:hypothetical protein